jgi:23S rRNA (uracil1939-C5)-methyltransferase
VLVTNGRHLPCAEKLTQALKQRIPGLCGVVQNINTRRGNVILGDENITLWGRPYLIELLEGIEFHISPHSFFQVNPVQTELLYRKAKEYAGLTGSETVFDLYCGIGTISLYLARFAAAVIGVESMPAAVEDARKNASLNNFKNVEFHTGLAEEGCRNYTKKAIRLTWLSLTPRAKAATKNFSPLSLQCNLLVLSTSSCNPATLARDLKYFSTFGYNAIEIQPVDMFPQTPHDR